MMIHRSHPGTASGLVAIGLIRGETGAQKGQRQGNLMIVLGLGACCLGAAASGAAEPATVARSIPTAGVIRPVATAAGATADADESALLCDSARHAACSVPGPGANPPGRSREERSLRIGTLAVLDASYEPQDARMELVHTASAARRRPLASLHMKHDWADLVAINPG